MTFSVIPSSGVGGMEFIEWRSQEGSFTPSSGSFTVPKSAFARQDTTDDYVLNVSPYWKQKCREIYISQGNSFYERNYLLEIGNTSHQNVYSTKPANSSPDDYAFVGWILDSTGEGSAVVPWSQLPYTTEKYVYYSWFNTQSDKAELKNDEWQMTFYAVWTPKIAVTYKDKEVDYSSAPVKVDPQSFNLMDRSALLKEEKDTNKRPESYPNYNLYKNIYRLVWNTEEDYTGTSYFGSQPGFRSDMTLYAQWNVEYEVDYYIKKDDGSYPTSHSFMKTFQQPKGESIDTLYYFVNDSVKAGYEVTGWSVGSPSAAKQTSVALSAFPENDYNSNKRRHINVYGEWTPRTYTFVYDVNYYIDGVQTGELENDVTGLPEGVDANNTIQITYDQLTSGYQLAPIAATGYRFDGWYIKYRPTDTTGSSQNANFIIPSSWITATTTNGSDSTILIRARWHRYNKYTFLYDRNLGECTVHENGTNTDVQTGLIQTHWGGTFTGQYKTAEDAELTKLEINTDAQWEDVFYQNELEGRKNPNNTS